MQLEKIKEIIYKAKGRREALRTDFQKLKDNLRKLQKRLIKIQKAQTIIQLVAKQTQEQLEYSLSEIVSLAMGIVFDDPYELSLNFGESKCEIKFKKDGKDFDPMFSAGGGVGNIAGNSLRYAILSVSQPRVRHLLLVDEPFPGLKGKERNALALQMLKTISEELEDLQIIMISDERVDREIIIENADKVFDTKLINGVTEIKEISK